MIGEDLPEPVRRRLVASKVAIPLVGKTWLTAEERAKETIEGEPLDPADARGICHTMLEDRDRRLVGSDRGQQLKRKERYRDTAGRSFEEAVEDAEADLEDAPVQKLLAFAW